MLNHDIDKLKKKYTYIYIEYWYVFRTLTMIYFFFKCTETQHYDLLKFDYTLDENSFWNAITTTTTKNMKYSYLGMTLTMTTFKIIPTKKQKN